ncbi:MAG TPA: hypothetical protein VHY37_07300 [Tepidisphaeraceae bacterium]|jgi:hypothetical protein|nr:hypothetical protein [Tepidisphaeraceae bacterium]
MHGLIIEGCISEAVLIVMLLLTFSVADDWAIPAILALGLLANTAVTIGIAVAVFT